MNNHLSRVVYDTRPRASDAEPLDLEKTYWINMCSDCYRTDNTHNSIILHGDPNISGKNNAPGAGGTAQYWVRQVSYGDTITPHVPMLFYLYFLTYSFP